MRGYLRSMMLTFALEALFAGCSGSNSDVGQAGGDSALTSCSSDSVAADVSRALSAMRLRNPVPGLSAAVFVTRDVPVRASATVGVSNLESNTPLNAQDRFLAGSVGKTFFAALALREYSAGRLDLDAPIASLIRANGLPSLKWITPRMLLTHTSGIGEYDSEFMTSLVREPLRDRVQNDWLDVLRRSPPERSAAGAFRYSDLNFVLLAMVLDSLEKLSGNAANAYAGIGKSFLEPLQLTATSPSITPRVRGLVPGYEAAKSMFGRAAMMEDGELIYNPQFEWGGGGFVSTPTDLARWMVAFREGEAFPDSLWPMVTARPAGVSDTLKHWRGMGIDIRDGALGRSYGHSGYMPGYVSWMRWYDEFGLSVAMQTNSTNRAQLTDDGFDWLDSIAVAVSNRCHRAPNASASSG